MRTLEERLASYKAALLEKAKRTNWGEEEEYSPCARRGRKAQARVRPESKPRTPGEVKAAKQKHYNWL